MRHENPRLCKITIHIYYPSFWRSNRNLGKMSKESILAHANVQTVNVRPVKIGRLVIVPIFFFESQNVYSSLEFIIRVIENASFSPALHHADIR